MIKRILATAGVLGAVLGGSLGAAGAAGAHVGHSAPAGHVRPFTGIPTYIVDTSGPPPGVSTNECMVTHGVGNQITLGTTGCANWTWTISSQTGCGGLGKYTIVDAHGNYLAINSSSAATVSATKTEWCNQPYPASGFEQLYTPGTIDYVGTNSLNSGTGVLVQSGLSDTVWN